MVSWPYLVRSHWSDGLATSADPDSYRYRWLPLGGGCGAVDADRSGRLRSRLAGRADRVRLRPFGVATRSHAGRVSRPCPRPVRPGRSWRAAPHHPGPPAEAAGDISSEGPIVTVIDHPTRITGPGSDPEPTDPAPADPVADPAAEPAAATLGVAGRVLLELDPRRLRDNPHNPRTDLGDLSELAASIAEAGVLEPLIVAPDLEDPGGHVIMFGHRRRAAAVEAGLLAVPCDVRAEYAGKTPEQVADMLAENLHRLDLTGLEEAAGYAQLAMFDWTPDRIARRVGRPAARVQAGLAAVKAPAPLRPKLLDGELTLEQAAAVEDFAGEPKAYERLLRTASTYPAGLHHALAEERHKQELAFRTATTRRGLVDDGVRVVAKPRDFPWSSVEVRLSDLSGPDGVPLTRHTHASCPGHAAFLESNAEVVLSASTRRTGATASRPATGTTARRRSGRRRRPRRLPGSGTRRWRWRRRRGCRGWPRSSDGRVGRSRGRCGLR